MVERIECEREADGRWIAEIVSIPGAMAYRASQDQAMALALAVAQRVIADRILSSDDTPSD
jgi:predicted RNase H-like HicB family nuclease